MPEQPMLNFAGWLMQMQKKEKIIQQSVSQRSGKLPAIRMANFVKIILPGLKVMPYKPGPYAPVEDQVINFVDWCIGQMREGLKGS
jgi:hypothetical protein